MMAVRRSPWVSASSINSGVGGPRRLASSSAWASVSFTHPYRHGARVTLGWHGRVASWHRSLIQQDRTRTRPLVSVAMSAWAATATVGGRPYAPTVIAAVRCLTVVRIESAASRAWERSASGEASGQSS